MPKVSSTEFAKNLGRYLDQAQHQPVTLTKHGRETLTVIRIDQFREYERLKEYDTRQALYPHELSDEEKAELEKGFQGRKTPELDHLLD